MDITPKTGAGLLLVTGYGNGGFTLNRQPHTGSLLLYGETAQAWHPQDADRLMLDQHSAFLDIPEIELLLVGTGQHSRALPVETITALRTRKIRFEIMDTGAACRTYNVLANEGRSVAAALQAV